MRKMMLLAAMLAMVLVAAAPAFGQATAIDDTSDTTYEDSFNTVCPQVVNAFGAQTNYGDANSAAADESEAAAAVAQEFGLSVEQVSACLGGIAEGDDTTTVVVEDDGSASASASASAAAGTAVLPETGGSSLLALGAGALLVGGGLLARRIVR